jgi:hypothetical protein
MALHLEPPAFYRVMNPGFHAGRKRFMTTAAQYQPQLQGIRMTGRTSLTIVLAAGEGTRMRSAAPRRDAAPRSPW